MQLQWTAGSGDEGVGKDVPGDGKSISNEVH
jgi:predicted small secreted protein